MVGLLEDLEGAQARGLELHELLIGERGGVHVDPPNAILVLADADRVGGLDRLDHVLHVVLRVVAEDQQQALVAVLDQPARLALDLGGVEGAALKLRVVAAEGAVEAVAHALVGDIQRGEEDDAVAVDAVLDLPRGLEERFERLRLLDQHQLRGLRERQALQRPRLHEQVVEASVVGRPRLIERAADLVLVDDPCGLDIVCGHHEAARAPPSPRLGSGLVRHFTKCTAKLPPRSHRGGRGYCLMIASNLQASKHAPQAVQTSLVITCASRGSPTMHCTGQTRLHRPQPTQRSASTS